MTRQQTLPNMFMTTGQWVSSSGSFLTLALDVEVSPSYYTNTSGEMQLLLSHQKVNILISFAIPPSLIYTTDAQIDFHNSQITRSICFDYQCILKQLTSLVFSFKLRIIEDN